MYFGSIAVETVLDSPERPPPAVAESDEEDLIPITPNNNIQNKSKKWVTKHQVDKDGFIGRLFFRKYK